MYAIDKDGPIPDPPCTMFVVIPRNIEATWVHTLNLHSKFNILRTISGGTRHGLGG